MSRRIVIAMTITVAALAAATTALAANPQPWDTPQAVVGYASTTQCVLANQPTLIVYTTINRSKAPKPVVITMWSITTLGEHFGNYGKGGPLLVVDTTRSGLIKTARLPVWHWAFTVPPGGTVEQTLFVVDSGDVPPLEGGWKPTWGPKPIPRFYSFTQGVVRYSPDFLDFHVEPTLLHGEVARTTKPPRLLREPRGTPLNRFRFRPSKGDALKRFFIPFYYLTF